MKKHYPRVSWLAIAMLLSLVFPALLHAQLSEKIKALEQACAAKSAEACMKLARFASYGGADSQVDVMNYLALACTLNNDDGCFNLRLSQLRGKVLSEDHQKALSAACKADPTKRYCPQLNQQALQPPPAPIGPGAQPAPIPSKAAAPVTCLHPWTPASPVSRKVAAKPPSPTAHAPSERDNSKCRSSECPRSSYVNTSVPLGASEVHLIGVYQAVSGRMEGGKFVSTKIRVVVHPSEKPTDLVLASYEPAVWEIEGKPGARVGRVFLTSYTPGSKVETAIKGIQVLPIEARTYFYTWEDNEGSSERFEHKLNAIRKAIGATEVSLQGDYAGKEFHVPFAKSLSDARARESSFKNAVSVQRLEAPLAQEISPIPDLPYTLHETGVRENSSGQVFPVPPDLPQLSWPQGLVFDEKRKRFVAITLGGEGFAYAFDPANKKWSILNSMNNYDSGPIVYDTGRDLIWSLNGTMGSGRVTEVRGYSPDLKTFNVVKLKQPIELNQRGPQVSLKLRIVRGMLMIESGSNQTLIDLQCGETQEL